jgi:hypothetical protein
LEDILKNLADAPNTILNQNIRINWYLCNKEHNVD